MALCLLLYIIWQSRRKQHLQLESHLGPTSQHSSDTVYHAMPGHTWLWAINFSLFQVKSRQLSIYLCNIHENLVRKNHFLGRTKGRVTITGITEISVPACFPYLKRLQTSAGEGWLSLTMTVPILQMKTAVKPTFSSVRLKVTGKVTRIHKLAHLTHRHLTKRCRFPLVSIGSRARFTYAQKKQVCARIY